MTQGSFEDLRWATKYQIKYLKEGKWVTYRKADGTLVSVKLLQELTKKTKNKLWGCSNVIRR